VSMAQCDLKLQMERRPPDMGIAMNILNNQLWTADKGWPSNLGVEHVPNTSP
jgi:hypothetical protein